MNSTRQRSGFSLIELLVVVVIIGVLAAVGIFRFSGSKERAYEATIRSDLRTLATRQETHFVDNERFSTSVDDLGFKPSQGMAVTIVQGDKVGWSAIMNPSGAEKPTCAVFFSNAAPVPPAEREGIVACQ